MKDFWDQRYAQTELAYGERPNDFLVEALGRIGGTGTTSDTIPVSGSR